MLSNRLLAARWEDRDGQPRVEVVANRQIQLVHVVPAIERIRLRIRARIEVDRGAQQTKVVQLVVNLDPARTTRRQNNPHTRRRARERIRQRPKDLARPADAEAEDVLRIVVEQAEQRARRVRARRQVAPDPVDDELRAVAVSRTRHVRDRQDARQPVVGNRVTRRHYL